MECDHLSQLLLYYCYDWLTRSYHPAYDSQVPVFFDITIVDNIELDKPGSDAVAIEDATMVDSYQT